MTHTLFSSLSRATLIVAVAIGFSAPSFADAQQDSVRRERPHDRASRPQQGRHSRMRRRHRRHRGHDMHRALRQLDLSDNQRAQVRAIFESANTRRREVAEMPEGDARFQARRVLRRETRRLVDEVLTPDQRTQAEQMKVRHHARRLDRRLDRMTRRLELTGPQVARVRAILEANAGQRPGADASTRQEAQAAREAHRANVRAQLDTVLTPAQAARMAERRDERGARRDERGPRRRGPRR